MKGSKSINQAVREILMSKPIILASLGMGVVNYSALARKLKRDVEKKLGSEVSEESIKIAVVRFKEQLYQLFNAEGVLKVVADSTTTLVDDVGLLTVKASDPQIFSPALTEAKVRLIQITQGVHTLTVVTDEEVLDKLLAVVDPRLVEDVYRNQAAVILISPKDIVTTPGVLAYLTTILAFNGINITQVISTHTDTLFILERQAAIDAYSLLREAIAVARGNLSKP